MAAFHLGLMASDEWVATSFNATALQTGPALSFQANHTQRPCQFSRFVLIQQVAVT
jgi:hypothetical protein